MRLKFKILGRPAVRLALVAAMAATAADGVAAEPTVVDHLTAPAGIGEYEWSLGIARILEQNSETLRSKPQPTQGYIYNLRYAIGAEDRTNLIFNCDPVSPWLAANNQPPFQDGLGDLEIRALMNATWPIWMLTTADEDIMTPADLKGRTVALGPKAGTATVMAEETLKALGVFDEVTLQYLSFADIFSGLLDGTIDVGLTLSWYNAADNKVGVVPGVLNLEQSGRGFHIVPWTEAGMRKTHDEIGVPYHILTVPDGTLPIQDGDVMLYANPDFVAVDATFPEDMAYEYVSQTLAHLEEINAAGGLGVLFTPAFLPYGIEEKLHPGALRAYRDAGLIE
ncbi:TAXI family TRAP transporter solute-binding subunit [Pikeienuella piscinae]|uniref:TAXI family TRAP transporter solute-binding subunit n=1 Tax=Pikeienuella piscinae TaxID=2748098 RepID=A0A7L5BT60_9RHOB|nr:TAXI family TRAP transporter solute-binding subunit [Pikeienuella piscinae]QIE55050.1 TAXI family TRAP transporter solute-binding subunit [Pikeienuella piscinae]